MDARPEHHDDPRLQAVVTRRLRTYRSRSRGVRPDPDAPPSLCALDLPARAECLAPVSAFVAEDLRRRGLPAAEVGMIELAIYEACLNVIEHAYGFDPTRRFRVEIVDDEDRVVFQIVNVGEPLDPRHLEEARAAAGGPVAHRAGRGLGLAIITRAMDDVSCTREPDGANRLTMVKSLREVPVKT